MLLLLMSIVFFFFNLIIFSLFFFVSKLFKFNNSIVSMFECGFSSYFYSRFSFSIHYFLLSLIFLFLDLELCFLMPFFNETLNSFSVFFLTFVLLILLMGLILEWSQGKLDWIF